MFCSLSLSLPHSFPLSARLTVSVIDWHTQDATRDLVLLGEQFEAEYKLTKNLEILTDRLQQTYRELVSDGREMTVKWRVCACVCVCVQAIERSGH